MSELSARLALPYLASGQAQKHVTVNEAFGLIDALIGAAALDRDLTSPPGSPEESDCYLVAATADGAWIGWDNDVAIFQDGAWRRIAPPEGAIVLVVDEARLLIKRDGAWEGVEAALNVLSIENAGEGVLASLGVNTAADAANRFALKSNAAMFSHDDVTPGSGDMRVIVNKLAAANSAELVFQDNFSGCAALGLAGADDFTLKVSADGAAWTNAVTVNRSTGQVSTGKLAVGGDVEVSGDTWRVSRVTVAAAGAWAQFVGRRARGTVAAPAAVQAGDTIYAFTPEAHDGASYVQSGGFDFIAETGYASAKNAYWRLATLDAGSWSEKLRVKANGDFGVGVAAPATKLDVNGPVRVKSYTVAGLPAATSIAGAIVYVSNEAGGAVLAFSDGSSWRRVTDRAVVS